MKNSNTETDPRLVDLQTQPPKTESLSVTTVSQAETASRSQTSLEPLRGGKDFRVEDYLPLIRSTVSRYNFPLVEREDVEEDTLLHLAIKMATSFDASRGHAGPYAKVVVARFVLKCWREFIARVSHEMP